MIALFLSGFSIVKGLFGGGSSPVNWKAIGIVLCVVAAMLLAWRGMDFVKTAQADAIAKAELTAKLDSEIAARAAADKQHADALRNAQAATATATARTADLNKTLENLRHAPRSTGCVPSPTARDALVRLRKP